jgi:antitoxin YefM
MRPKAVPQLSSIIETAYLLRSPRNARRLLTALIRAQGKKLKQQNIQKLRREIGFAEKSKAPRPVGGKLY